MPWNCATPMTEKFKFIVASQDYSGSFASLCRSFGISTKTGYKWLARYELHGLSGLSDLSRRPLHSHNQLPDDIVSLFVQTRKEHPNWGPKKLRAFLQAKDPQLLLPAPSTISDWLKRYGLIKPRKRRLRVPLHTDPFAPCAFPNEVWCVDFKGNFEMKDGARCYPLTLMDAHSRYLLKCEGLPNQQEHLVRHHFELAFQEFGVPRRIRSDNGSPFASLGIGGLSALSIWWIKLGIIPERIEPGHPEQNGRHERMHRTLKEEAVSPPKENFLAQQKAFDEFRKEYNEVRPHEALKQEVPYKHYIVSPRAYPKELREVEYPTGYEIRRVHKNGEVGFAGGKFAVSTLIAREAVGLKEVGDQEWEMYYGPVKLGKVRKRKEGIRFERK